jgi:hypothetical protein
MNRLQRVTSFYINAQFGRFLIVGGIALVLHRAPHSSPKPIGDGRIGAKI